VLAEEPRGVGRHVGTTRVARYTRTLAQLDTVFRITVDQDLENEMIVVSCKKVTVFYIFHRDSTITFSGNSLPGIICLNIICSAKKQAMKISPKRRTEHCLISSHRNF
jgi:hypothetical protein